MIRSHTPLIHVCPSVGPPAQFSFGGDSSYISTRQPAYSRYSIKIFDLKGIHVVMPISLSLSLERSRVLLFSVSSFPSVLLRFLFIGKNRRADQSADKSNSPILFSLFFSFFFFSRRSLKTHPNYYNREKKNIKEKAQ